MTFQRKIQLSEFDLLTLRWDANWANLNVKFNATDLDSFTDKESLQMGKWVTLPTGKTLMVRLVKEELEVWDGKDELVSGLKSGESDHFAAAWKTLIGYGIVFLIIGSVVFANNESKMEFGIPLGVSALGAVYIALANWARNKQEKMPLKIAIGIQGLITVLTFLSGILPAVLMAILIYSLYKGINANPLKISKIEYIENEDLLDDAL
jgi:hypothetical protein